MTEEERYESFAETRPRLAAALSGSFSVYDDQESDDFVVIDLVNSEKETPSSSPNPTAPSSPASPSEAKKELEYDDYVELFIDDANVSRTDFCVSAACCRSS